MHTTETLTTSVSPELLDLMNEIEAKATDATDPVDTAYQIHDAISAWVNKHYRRSMRESEKRVLGTLVDLAGQGISGCPQDAEQALDKLSACLPFLKVRSNPFGQLDRSAPAVGF